jgi:hypothetical protein
LGESEIAVLALAYEPDGAVREAFDVHDALRHGVAQTNAGKLAEEGLGLFFSRHLREKSGLGLAFEFGEASTHGRLDGGPDHGEAATQTREQGGFG